MLQVVTGTLAQIATSPVFADYADFEDPNAAEHSFGLLEMLAAHATLSPMCTQPLAESWCYTTQFPLGGLDPRGDWHQQGYGYLSLTQLNPNGVPNSYAVELWLTGADVSVHYRVTVYGKGDSSLFQWVAYDRATNTPLPDQQLFATHLHAALHDYPSALVVDA